MTGLGGVKCSSNEKDRKEKDCKSDGGPTRLDDFCF